MKNPGKSRISGIKIPKLRKILDYPEELNPDPPGFSTREFFGIFKSISRSPGFWYVRHFAIGILPGFSNPDFHPRDFGIFLGFFGIFPGFSEFFGIFRNFSIQPKNKKKRPHLVLKNISRIELSFHLSFFHVKKSKIQKS